ncbi:MAG: BTAD domain-containing putative transcriptional regulator [Propionibacteriales bacterium]|nr:BTAD domain-containing putative transcriptional regulator [Propionibacteriales bacterium]
MLVLGSIEVLLNGVSAEISGAKERTLLSLLLTYSGRTVSSHILMNELWSHKPPVSAPSGLHVFVSRLRRQLGDWGAERLRTSPSGYALRVEDHEVDATNFATVVADGRTLLEAGDAESSRARLREGLQLWRGPAYAGVRSLIVEAEAARLEEVRLAAQEALFDAELALGHHAGILLELEQVIAEHPFRERYWAQRMVALYRCGRQADALMAYQSLRALTREELGFEPTPELQRLELAVLEHDPTLDWAAPSGSVTLDGRARSAPTGSDEGWPRIPLPPALWIANATPLVGRDHDLRQLAKAQTGTSLGAALISGEPGVGKSRLAAAAAQQAHDEGATVILGRCDADAVTAYQPVAEALQWIFEHVPEEALLESLGSKVLERLRLIADPTAPGTSAMARLDADRVDLFEAAAAMIRALSSTRRLVIVMEDLHWLDGPTAALLRYLARRNEGDRVTMLATHRPLETIAMRPLDQMVGNLRRNGGVLEISLAGLSVSDVNSVAANLLGRPLSADLSTALHEGTNGNPLFLLELTRHLVDTDVLGLTENEDEATAVRNASPPAGIQHVVGERVARLGPTASETLGVASVVGMVFDLELVASVGGEDASGVSVVLDRAVAAGLLLQLTEVPGRFTFAHALIRHALYERLSPSQRVEIHRAVAETLEEHDWGTAAQRALHHYEAAASGSARKAVDSGIRAAREALRSLAFEDAVEVLRRTLRLATARGKVRDRLDLLIELGEALWWAGETAESDAVCTQALELARQEGDVELFARAVLGRWRNNGAATQGYSASAPDTDLVDMLEEALSGLTEHPALRAALLGRLGIASYWTAPLERRRELADSAVALARAAADETVLLDALVDRQLALWTPGGEVTRLQQSKEILSLARRLGQPAREADARIFEALDHLALGDVRAADVSVQRYLRASAMLRQPYYRWHAHFLPALLAMIDGRFEEAEALTTAGAAEGGAPGLEGALSLSGLQMLWVAYERGQLDLVAPFLDDVGENFGEIPALDAARTWVAAEAGDLDKAGRLLRELADNEFGVVQTDIAWLAALCLLGSAASKLDNQAAAARLHEMLLPHSGRNALVWVGFCCGPVDHYLGQLAQSLGRADEAIQRYDAAIALAVTMGSAPLASRIRLDRCELELTFEDRNPAQIAADLRQIALDAGQLGMARVAARAQDLIEVTRPS